MKHGIYHTERGYELYKDGLYLGCYEFLTTANIAAIKNNVPVGIK